MNEKWKRFLSVIMTAVLLLLPLDGIVQGAEMELSDDGQVCVFGEKEQGEISADEANQAEVFVEAEDQTEISADEAYPAEIFINEGSQNDVSVDGKEQTELFDAQEEQAEVFVEPQMQEEITFSDGLLTDLPQDEMVLDYFTEEKYYINPLYADWITPADLEPVSERELLFAGDTVYYTKMKDAAAAMRPALVQRSDIIEIGYQIPIQEYYDELVWDILMVAMEHTGVPNEGDYLAYQYAGAAVGIVGTQQGTVWNLTLVYAFAYFTDFQQEKAVNEKLATVMKSLNLSGKSEYQKAKLIYDYICSHVTYDYAHLQTPDYFLQYSAYAALMQGTSVCSGYAVLFYRMALEAGLDCRYIGGETDDGERHAWNIVRIGSKYYNLDATWDAGNSNYQWFLKSMGTFPDHHRDAEFTQASYQTQYPMGTKDYTQEPAKKGSCGTSLTWKVDVNLVLSIQGSGVMKNYSDASPAPWSELGVKRAVIGEGVTSIGKNAFSGNQTLLEVQLPSSLTQIGNRAFYKCVNLKAPKLPSSLKTIGTEAFASCSSFGKMAIPESVTSIGKNAWKGCKSLVIQALTGSTAEVYASANGISFQSTGVIAPTLQTAKNVNGGIQITWNKVSGAKGYRLYRKTTGGWQKLKDISSGSTIAYTDKSVKSGTVYRYQIRVLNNGKLVSSLSSQSVSSRYLAVPSLTSVKNSAKGTITATWKKVTGVSGYEIAYKTGTTTKKIKVKASVLKKAITGLKKNKTYSISIRSYYQSGSTVKYSAWSSATKVKVKK